MIRAPITTVFFDAAGTLFRLRESVGTGYARVGREFGIQLDAESTDHAFRDAWKAAPPPYPSEETEPERVWWRNLVERILERCEQPMRDPYFEALWAHYARSDTWELFEDTPAAIQQLLEMDLRLGLISNFDSRLNSILDGFGIAGHFDPIVISSEVRARKPAPRIFSEALNRADCRPDQALHVGDESQADWDGAAQAGFRVFQLRRPENTLLDLVSQLSRGARNFS